MVKCWVLLWLVPSSGTLEHWPRSLERQPRKLSGRSTPIYCGVQRATPPFRCKLVISQDTKYTDRTILLKIFARLGISLTNCDGYYNYGHTVRREEVRDVCVGMRVLSCGFNCLIRAYSQLHGYSHDTNTQSAGQWRTRSRVVATLNTRSGDAKHRQWRHKTRGVATQNTGSNVLHSAFRRGGGSSTAHRPMSCTSQIHTKWNNRNKLSMTWRFDSCEHSGFNVVQLGMFYTDKHTDSIFHSEDEGSMFFRRIGAQPQDHMTSQLRAP